MIDELKDKAKSFRRDILTMVHAQQSGHIGGAFSIIDFLSALYLGRDKNGEKFFNYTKDPKDPGRDYFILSKAHCSAAMYSIFSSIGYIPHEELIEFRKLGSRLQGHVTNKVPGAEISGGSLGQGLSIVNGIALGLKLDSKDNKVWGVFGDGELQEGQIWEAAMSAGKFKLNNLIAIVDRNKLQIDGKTETVMPLEPLANKWLSFGWQVIETNGNHMESVLTALKMAIDSKEKPTIIIANTTMGKGVKSIENNPEWHGKAPAKEQVELFLKELN